MEASSIAETEEDLLSNIISALNDAHQTDFTEEDKVDIDTIRRRVNEDEELRQVMEADNTERNRHRKFGEVLDTIFAGFSSITSWNCITSYRDPRLRRTS